MTSPPLASIIVLCWKSQDYILPCLQSLAAMDEAQEVEVIVLDNASEDEGAQRARDFGTQHPGVFWNYRVEVLTTNRGCCGGNNAGAQLAHPQSPCLIFLNPDTEVTSGFARALKAPLDEDPSIGITGAKIYYPGTRTLQHAGGYLHPNAMSGHYGAHEEDQGQHDTLKECGYVTGAGFAIRRDLFQQLGGFDEDYFPAYFEETDLCARAQRQGYRVVYTPHAVFYHHESVSLVVDSPGFRRLYQRMRIRYLLKNCRLRGLWRAAAFELRWMLREPAARGHRREQFRAYAEGIAWAAGKLWKRLTAKAP